MLSKCRKCHFRDPKFKYFLTENPPGPAYICHHFVGAQMFFSHRGPHTRSAATVSLVHRLQRVFPGFSSTFSCLVLFWQLYVWSYSVEYRQCGFDLKCYQLQIVKDNYKLDTTCPEFMRYSFNSRSLCHRKTY